MMLWISILTMNKLFQNVFEGINQVKKRKSMYCIVLFVLLRNPACVSFQEAKDQQSFSRSACTRGGVSTSEKRRHRIFFAIQNRMCKVARLAFN